jgi:hypothetical protein
MRPAALPLLGRPRDGEMGSWGPGLEPDLDKVRAINSRPARDSVSYLASAPAVWNRPRMLVSIHPARPQPVGVDVLDAHKVAFRYRVRKVFFRA